MVLTHILVLRNLHLLLLLLLLLLHNFLFTSVFVEVRVQSAFDRRGYHVVLVLVAHPILLLLSGCQSSHFEVLGMRTIVIRQS